MNMQLHSSSPLVDGPVKFQPLATQFAKNVQDEAASRRLPVLDATCPLLAKVQITASAIPQNDGRFTHRSRRSSGGGSSLGQITPRASFSALQARFTDIQGPDIRDICYATQNRQSAVRDLSKLVDITIVVRATNSSNASRLREIGTETGVASYLIADDSELNSDWLTGVRTVGITAGASAPEVLVDDVIELSNGWACSPYLFCRSEKKTLSFVCPPSWPRRNRATRISTKYDAGKKI